SATIRVPPTTPGSNTPAMTRKAAAAVVSSTTPEAILEALKARLAAARFKEARVLAEAFFARTPEDDLRARSAEAWAGLIAGFFEFMRERRAESPVLRIFNPDPAEHGFESSHTVVQIVNDDMPFLVDSVSMAIAQAEVQIHAMIHPVLKVQRDPGGVILGLGRGISESLMHVEIDRQAEPEDLQRLQASIMAALADVRACVRDWRPMRERMLQVMAELPERSMPVSDEGRAEAQEFLRWVADDHFTFLGYREYEVARVSGDEVLRAVEGTGLGLLAGGERAAAPRSLKTLAAHDLPQSGSVDALILTKTNSRSTVHRPGYMDYIGVLEFDAKGVPV